MTTPELYRMVFNVPGGLEVLADLAAKVAQMPPEHAGSAGQLLAHISKQLYQAEKPAPKRRPDPMAASGGRIQHG
jgi:hypothetical protein